MSRLVSCSILCSCPQLIALQLWYHDQSSQSSLPNHPLDCFGVPSGQRQSSAWHWRHWIVSACSPFYVGIWDEVENISTEDWLLAVQRLVLLVPSFHSFSFLFPLLFTTCHSHYIFPYWCWNLTWPKMRMWDEISHYSSYCPSFLFCHNHWAGGHTHIPQKSYFSAPSEAVVGLGLGLTPKDGLFTVWARWAVPGRVLPEKAFKSQLSWSPGEAWCNDRLKRALPWQNHFCYIAQFESVQYH